MGLNGGLFRDMSRNYPRGRVALCGFGTKEQGGAERVALFDHFISNPSSSLMREREKMRARKHVVLS